MRSGVSDNYSPRSETQLHLSSRLSFSPFIKGTISERGLHARKSLKLLTHGYDVHGLTPGPLLITLLGAWPICQRAWVAATPDFPACL